MTNIFDINNTAYILKQYQSDVYNSRNRKPSALFEIQKNGVIVENRRLFPSADNLYTSLKLYWKFGYFLGILPIQGIGSSKNSCNLKFSPKSIPVLWNYIACTVLFVNLLVGAWNLLSSTKQTASDVATQSTMLMFYSMGFLTYNYFRRNSNKFINLFCKWKEMKPLHFDNGIEDTSLGKDAYCIGGIIFGSAICENLFLFLLQSRLILPQDHNNVEFSYSLLFDYFFFTTQPEWSRIYSWEGHNTTISNCLDISIIIFSRALYYKFKKFNSVARKRLIVEENCGINDLYQWKAFTKDFTILVNLLQEFIAFLSPLVFVSCAVNLYFVCIQIKLGLAPQADPENRSIFYAIYTIWSFIHLNFRIFVVALSAARINEHINQTHAIIQFCPVDSYQLEVQRMDQWISNTQIGLTGIGCFVVTKPFLLKIIGVIFTFEIVLLQPQSS